MNAPVPPRKYYEKITQDLQTSANIATPSIAIESYDTTKHSTDEITSLLHRSYARLLDMGLQFWATHQDSEVTHRRLVSGLGFIVSFEGKIVGTITYYDDCSNNDCQWYKNSFVSRFGQFAVEPRLQRLGIGSKLIRHIETLAKSRGKTELALDTSEKAVHLIDYYSRKGFRHIQFMQWHGVNYRSVVMSKKI